MAKGTTTQRPRKALGETPSAELNKKRPADDTEDSAPRKTQKYSTIKANAGKQSSLNPPNFVYEIDLPGDEDVWSLVSNSKII